MKKIVTSLLLSFFQLSIAAKSAPIVDGSCDEYNFIYKLLNKDISWYIHEDSSNVWFCFTYPENGIGILDLVIETPKINPSINLHSSAQLGEWPENQPESQPQSPTSALWWNNQGWIATVQRFNGIKEKPENPNYPVKFKSPNAVEIQLRKERFGSGQWIIKKIEISHVRRESFNNDGRSFIIIVD